MKLPILNYHGFESRSGEYDWLAEEVPYVLETNIFEKQLDEIRAKGFTSIGLNELKSGKSEKPIMITFDDGLSSHYAHAARILRAKNLKGLFFIPAMRIGEKGFMSWEELKLLVKDGFEIGSHGLRHVALTQLPEAEVREEFELSKKMLEQKLGVSVKSFSIPRGYYSPSMREIAQKAGYEFLFTSSYDINPVPPDLFFLKRLVVKRATTPEQFTNLIEGNLGLSRPWEKVKETVRTHTPAWFYDGLAALKRGVKSS